MLFDPLLRTLEEELRASLGTAVTTFVATALAQFQGAVADVDRERAVEKAEVAHEKAEVAKEKAEVAKEKADLHREIAAMQKQQEAQRGRVVLDIGGYRYTTSVQTLRRLPGTFFDAYFSGRYTVEQSEDGSIFIDRDGKHFGQVLEYLRDGVILVAEQELVELDVSELRWLKREFGFYCIELYAEPQEMLYAVGGLGNDEKALAAVSCYDAMSGACREVAPLPIARQSLSLCASAEGELYAIGGIEDDVSLAIVERYDPTLDTWVTMTALPHPWSAGCACVVGDAIYVLGGVVEDEEAGCGVQTISTVMKFDTLKQTWSEVKSIPEAREASGMCVLGSSIYVFGGLDEDEMVTSTAYRFSTDTNVWSTLAPMPEAKWSLCACTLGGLMYLIGGRDYLEQSKALHSVHRYDPVANMWSELTPLASTQTVYEAFVLDGNIYAVAGSGWETDNLVISTQRYCIDADRWSEVATWSEVSEMNGARRWFKALVVLVC
jgi:N-acetylneuraminic acid mutarotase